MLSLVVPTLNEAGNMTPFLERVTRALAGRRHEILVVDDDSTDGTAEQVERFGASHPAVRVQRRLHERGLASAVIAGFSQVQGDMLAVMDADLQHDPDILPRLAEALDAGADLAVGSRYADGGGMTGWAWHRRWGSRSATALARRLLSVPLADPMSGFFALRREVFLRARPHLSGRGFKILLELCALGQPKRVVEVPYQFGLRREGRSKLNSGVLWDYLRTVWSLRRRQAQLPSRGRAR